MPSASDTFSGVLYSFCSTSTFPTLPLGKEEEALKVKVNTDAAKVKISLNGNVADGNEATFEKLKDGENQLLVQCTANDGLFKVNYRITVYKHFDADAGIKEVVLNEKDITSDFLNEQKASEQFVDRDKVALKVTALDPDATVEVKQVKKQVAKGNSFDGELDVYNGLQNIDITVTAADGKTKETYHIALRKGAHLSDLEWESATVGYGDGVNRDKNHSGDTIQLADENGKPVSFEKGLGVHAESVIIYDVEGKGYKALEGFAGIDYCQYNAEFGAVQFIIEIDGEQVFDSGEMVQKDPMQKFEVEVPEGAKKVVLKALQGENNYNDHADWADAKFLGEFPEEPEQPEEPEKTYKVNVKTNDDKMGTVEVNPQKETYKAGEEVTVTASAKEGYQFVGWLEGEEIISTEAEYRFTVEKDVELTAKFEEKKTDPGEPEEPQEPEEPEEPQEPQDPQKPQKPEEPQKPQKPEKPQTPFKNPVKTGDNNQLPIALTGCVVSALALIILMRKREFWF